MTRNFQLHFQGRLPLSTFSKTSVPLDNGISESQKNKDEVMKQLYFDWLSGRPSEHESFRQNFIRTILIEGPEAQKNYSRQYFIWHFIEGFSLDEIAIITGKNSLCIGKELWACFLLAEKHYHKIFGNKAADFCGEEKFLLLYNWFNNLLNQNQEMELVEEIGLSEPLQCCFEIYLELQYGKIEEEILNRLQYGGSGKPMSAGDFIRQVKTVIENKGNSRSQK